MAEVIQIWQDFTCHVEIKGSRREATLSAIFFAVAPYHVKPSLSEHSLQMGQCKHKQSCCKYACLHRWGGPGMQAYQLAQETVDLHIPGLYPKQGGSRERMDTELNIWDMLIFSN